MNDQNVLSGWEDITISTNSNNPTEMAYDGFYTVSIVTSYNSGVNKLKVYVNAIQLVDIGSTGGNDAGAYQATIPIKKGDLLYMINGSDNNPTFSKCRYYKLRDYSMR